MGARPISVTTGSGAFVVIAGRSIRRGIPTEPIHIFSFHNVSGVLFKVSNCISTWLARAAKNGRRCGKELWTRCKSTSKTPPGFNSAGRFMGKDWMATVGIWKQGLKNKKAASASGATSVFVRFLLLPRAEAALNTCSVAFLPIIPQVVRGEFDHWWVAPRCPRPCQFS